MMATQGLLLKDLHAVQSNASSAIRLHRGTTDEITKYLEHEMKAVSSAADK